MGISDVLAKKTVWQPRVLRWLHVVSCGEGRGWPIGGRQRHHDAATDHDGRTKTPGEQITCCPDGMSWFGRRDLWRPCQGVDHPRQPPRCPWPQPPHCDFATSLLLGDVELGFGLDKDNWVKLLSVPGSLSPELYTTEQQFKSSSCLRWNATNCS